MREALKGFRTAAWQSAVEIAYFFPIVTLLGIFVVKQHPLAVYALLLGCYLTGYIVGGLTRVRRSMLQFALAVVLAVAVELLAFGFAFPGIVTVLPMGIAFLRGIRMVREHWRGLFPFEAELTALILFALIPALMSRNPEWSPQAGLVAVVGFLVFGYFTFAGSRQRLQDASYSRNGQGVTASVARQARVWAGAAMIIMLALSLFRQIEAALEKALAWFISGVLALLSRLTSGGTESKPEPTASPQPDMLGGMQGEPSKFAQWLERVLTAVVPYLLIAVAAVLLFIAVRAAYRLLRRWWGAARAERSGMEEGAGYVDEKEQLFRLADLTGTLADSLRKRLGLRNGPRWSELGSNRERVRYVYRAALKVAERQGFRPDDGQTPAETAAALAERKLLSERQAAALAPLYDAARYGGQEPPDESLGKLLATGILPHSGVKGPKG